MTAIAATIVQLFEIHSLSVEEIASEQELDPLAVKALLIQFSPLYKKSIEESEKEEEFVSKEEIKEFVESYKSIARYSEEVYVKERALKNLINLGLKVTDGLGEQDPKALIKVLSNNTNILVLSQNLQAAREVRKKAKEGLSKIIDIGEKVEEQIESF